jgi:hypothetical protein
MTARITVGAALTLAFAAGFLAHGLLPGETPVLAQSARVFELRTYTTNEGKLGALSDRFRDHTMTLFRKHGMESLGYFTPQDDPAKQNTLIYLIAHKDRAAAAKSWADFLADPEWRKVSAESEANGRLIAGMTTVYLDPTSYSPMK